MTQNNDYIDHLVLSLKYDKQGYDLIDYAIAQGEDVPVRNMCAKVHPVLIERLDDICETLNVSKRRFIESAVATAIHQAEDSLAQHFPGGES
jgi:hypothetical protein